MKESFDSYINGDYSDATDEDCGTSFSKGFQQPVKVLHPGRSSIRENGIRYKIDEEATGYNNNA